MASELVQRAKVKALKWQSTWQSKSACRGHGSDLRSWPIRLPRRCASWQGVHRGRAGSGLLCLLHCPADRGARCGSAGGAGRHFSCCCWQLGMLPAERRGRACKRVCTAGWTTRARGGGQVSKLLSGRLAGRLGLCWSCICSCLLIIKLNVNAWPCLLDAQDGVLGLRVQQLSMPLHPGLQAVRVSSHYLCTGAGRCEEVHRLAAGTACRLWT